MRAFSNLNGKEIIIERNRNKCRVKDARCTEDEVERGAETASAKGWQLDFLRRSTPLKAFFPSKVLLLLIDDDDDVVEAEKLKREYEAMFVQPLDLPAVLCEMRSYVDVIFHESDHDDDGELGVGSESCPTSSSTLHGDAILSRLSDGEFWLRLCPLQRFARRVRFLLSRRVIEDGEDKLLTLGRQRDES